MSKSEKNLTRDRKRHNGKDKRMNEYREHGREEVKNNVRKT